LTFPNIDTLLQAATIKLKLMSGGAGKGMSRPQYLGMITRCPNISAHLEDELAPEMARLAQSMGVGCLRQAIELDLRRAYGPRLKQLDDALEMPAGASNRRPQRRYIVAAGFWRLRAGSDERRPTARLEHREGPLCHIAADTAE
jgi:hypothetical protein